MSFLDDFTPTNNSDNRECRLYVPQENTMTIGATTTHIFTLPFIYSEYVKRCEIIYKQGSEILLLKDDYIVQEENSLENKSIIKVILSPEETAAFVHTICDTFVQLKIINCNEEVAYSTPAKIKVINSLDNGWLSI